MHNALSRINFRKITNLLEYVFRSMAKKNITFECAHKTIHVMCIFFAFWFRKSFSWLFFTLPSGHPPVWRNTTRNYREEKITNKRMSKHSVVNAAYLLIKYEYIICTIDLDTKENLLFLGSQSWLLILCLIYLLPRRKRDYVLH